MPGPRPPRRGRPQCRRDSNPADFSTIRARVLLAPGPRRGRQKRPCRQMCGRWGATSGPSGWYYVNAAVSGQCEPRKPRWASRERYFLLMGSCVLLLERPGSFVARFPLPRTRHRQMLGIQLRGVAYCPTWGAGTARDCVAALSDHPAGLSDPPAYESIRRAGWTARATSRHIWPLSRSRSREIVHRMYSYGIWRPRAAGGALRAAVADQR